MERRKTLTMNWDGLHDDDDDDHFFEAVNRISTAVPLDLGSSSDEYDFEDSRMSFASATSTASTIPSILSKRLRTFSKAGTATVEVTVPNFDYNIWMAAPGSITERRKRLLHCMGLDENKELLKVTNLDFGRAISKKYEAVNDSYSSSSSRLTPSATTTSEPVERITEPSPVPFVLVRSRSDGDVDSSTMPKLRKEEMIGNISKQRLTRTSSDISTPRPRICPYTGEPNRHDRKLTTIVSNSGFGTFFLIKNLDTGKEFIVNGYGEDGTWNRLSDLQTGKQLTLEEFEKTVGHSPVVKELMRRENVGREGHERKPHAHNYISKSLRMSKKTGAALLKNIKVVGRAASGFISEREREVSLPEPVPVPLHPPLTEQKPIKNGWVRVRNSGKSFKELSALHLCQEFQAHEGCIWTIKFSWDGHYLASAGEDKVIHVWEVQECELMSLAPEEGNLTPIHPSLLASPDRNGVAETPPLPGEKKKKGKSGGKKGNTIPDYVHVPETVFSLSEKPYCSLEGHLDDVLDLSWSKSQLLLSSSMDKTVRLWDVEMKMCLKMFAHNDYVTCIQFNPIDDDYFISGSLDAKVRVWNIPRRHVVDWADIHEMVTAISYTPDGLAALVGTHKGSCCIYSTEDIKLSQTSIIELHNRKKSSRKVTGFQFVPGNPTEVLVTSADNRIRIVDGTKVVHKFQGLRNANSQIAASFSPNGRHIISASEDSQVYIWKHEDHRNAGNGKTRHRLVHRSHEHFQCKHVSVAISWPFTIKGDPPPVPVRHSKRQSKRSSAASSQTPSSCGSLAREDNPHEANSKTSLPPLPKKNTTEDASSSPDRDPGAISRTENGTGDSSRMSPPVPKKSNNHATEGASTSQEEDPAAISNTDSGYGDSFANSERSLPPVPKKRNNQAIECNSSITPEEEFEAIARTETGIGDSFASDGSSIRFDHSPSISSAANPSTSSWSSSWSSFDSGHANPTSHPSAWGLVLVTASLGGEIRCYQNLGLPRRIGRQGGLFGGPS